jgi:translation initiation factor IF-1
MAKEELIQFEGLVIEALPDARFRVQLDAGHEIVAYTAGRMKKGLGRRSRDYRNVSTRPGEGTTDLSTQG